MVCVCAYAHFYFVRAKYTWWVAAWDILRVIWMSHMLSKFARNPVGKLLWVNAACAQRTATTPGPWCYQKSPEEWSGIRIFKLCISNIYDYVHAWICTYTHVHTFFYNVCVCKCAHPSLRFVYADHFKLQKQPYRQFNSSDRARFCNYLFGSSNDFWTFVILLVFQNMGNA